MHKNFYPTIISAILALYIRTPMALDNSLYDSLQDTFFHIKDYLENAQLIREHSPMMLKHEELGKLLDSFDVEEIEEQTKNINNLHEQLNTIKAVSDNIVLALKKESDTIVMIDEVVKALDEIFVKIDNIVL